MMLSGTATELAKSPTASLSLAGKIGLCQMKIWTQGKKPENMSSRVRIPLNEERPFNL